MNGSASPLPSRPWRTLSGENVDDVLVRLRDLSENGAVVHVGTDSRTCGGHTDFVTAVAVHHPGEGGRVLYRSRRGPRIDSLAQRLIQEAVLSIEVATQIAGELENEIVLHIDANVEPRHRSSRYAPMLAGMGLGSGFSVRLKPDAWCATHVADYVVKERHVRAA